MTDIRKTLKRHAAKSEKTANYTRLDCVNFGGVQYVYNNNNTEDCKSIIIQICKELHYWYQNTLSQRHTEWNKI